MIQIIVHDSLEDKTIIVEEDSTDFETIHYMWQEGNFACDCNRARAFKENADCGTDRYVVPFMIVDGQLIGVDWAIGEIEITLMGA